MFDLSFSKLFLLAVIALIVLGPEKLPKVARMAGAMLRRARVGWESVRAEVEREIEMEEIKRAAHEAAAHADAARNVAEGAARDARKAIDESVAEVKATGSSAVSAGSRDGDV